MKPIITKTDFISLTTLIRNLPGEMKTADVAQLVRELERADVVNDDAIPDDVIRLNSTFVILDTATRQKMRLTLTLPKQSDIKLKKISVLSPMGVALIGFRKGMLVEWNLPGGRKNISIEEVEQHTEINAN